MSINLSVPQNKDEHELKPRITVIGVGGGGCNAVNNMIESKLDGVEFLVANTDAQSLSQSHAGRKVQLGAALTQGLGAGSRPEIGRAAAEESLEEIMEQLSGSHMAFIAAGMGGGTGTGAAPVIARAAREKGILTVGVVTKPFQFEGTHRMRLADKGIAELEEYVDTLIIIPNQNLFRVATEKTTFADAFGMADDVLHAGVRGVTDLMIMPGMINLDFADIRSVMSEMGKAVMGTGEAEGERRALDAAEAAISNPLLDDISMTGAKGVLINITGGEDMTLFEVDEAANRIRAEVDPEAYIIFGSTFSNTLEGKMRVSVVATGMDANADERPVPRVLTLNDAVATRSAPVAPVAEEAATPQAPAVASKQDQFNSMETAARMATVAPMSVSEETTIERAEDTVDVSVDERVEIAQERAPEAPVTIASGDTPNLMGEMDVTQELELVDDISDAPTADEAVAQEDDEVEQVAETVEPVMETAPEPETVVPPVAVAQSSDAVYIPPAPVQARETPAPTPEPFAAAAMANGGVNPETAKRAPKAEQKRRSLFDMVTGGVSAMRSGESKAEPVEKAQPAPQAVQPPSQPAPRPVQQPLGGLQAAERLPGSQKEQDLLEIPAFLRRQAN